VSGTFGIRLKFNVLTSETGFQTPFRIDSEFRFFVAGLPHDMDKQQIIDITRRWIDAVVIGLNLCPFAERVFHGDKIRYVVSDAEDDKSLRADLVAELKSLAAVPITKVETTLLIHPKVFADFLEYNDFLDVAERLIKRNWLEGVIQIASFHPHYQFADTDADAVENYTNRSPFPMLHLLREESVSQIAGDPDDLLEIPRRNIATLNALGKEKILEILKGTGDVAGT